MSVLIIKPRLDCTFKEGACPVEEDKSIPLPSIRQHWRNFLNKIERCYVNGNTEVHKIELPLWQLTPQMVHDECLKRRANIVMIPHRNKYNFPVKVANPIYYMQTVFPFLFTMDNSGWGAFRSDYPIKLFFGDRDKTNPLLEELKQKAKLNQSKFEQPNVRFDKSGYVLFVCQIPHDEVILRQSKVSVAFALKATLEMCRKLGLYCVVKTHPVNPGSMVPLIQLQSQYNDCSELVDNCSIHSLLENADSVITVNSGVGYEALLHYKQLFCFGDVEYDCVAHKFKSLDIAEEYSYVMDRQDPIQLGYEYDYFMNYFLSNCIDTRN